MCTAAKRLTRVLPAPPIPEVILLAAFDGIATAAAALLWLGCRITLYISWEIDPDAIAVIKHWFPAAKHRGDLFQDDMQAVHDLVSAQLAHIPVIVAAGPPCPDFSRLRPHARGHAGPEGCKFKRFVQYMHAAVPQQRAALWIVENVAMQPAEQAVADDAMGNIPVKIDAKHFGPVNRPRLWWTKPPIQPGTSPGQDGWLIPQVPKLQPTEVSFDGTAHDKILNGTTTFPCLTTPAPDERGRAAPRHTRLDATTERRWREHGRQFAPWNYKDEATVQTAAGRRALNPDEKEQLHWLPPRYTKAASSDRARHRLLGNGWHAGVALFVIAHLLQTVTATAPLRPSQNFVQEAANLFHQHQIRFGPGEPKAKTAVVHPIDDPAAHWRQSHAPRPVLDRLPTIDPTIWYCLHLRQVVGRRMSEWRDAVLSHVRRMIQDHEDDTTAWISARPRHVQAAYSQQGRTTQVPTFLRLLEIIQYPDAHLPDEMTNGFHMLDRIPPGVHWTSRSDTKYMAPVSPSALQERNEEYMRQKMHQKFDTVHGPAMHQEILTEAQMGRVEGPFAPPPSWGGPPSGLPACPDNSILASCAFAITQLGSDGQDKVRRGEDWRRSHHNSTVLVDDAPSHHTIDHYMALGRATIAAASEGLEPLRSQIPAALLPHLLPEARAPLICPVHDRVPQASTEMQQDLSLQIWGHDHEGAYRQLPLRHPHQAYVLIQTKDGPELWRHNVLLFGAVASVWGYNRFGDAMCALSRVLLGIPCLHYVDDFGCVELTSAAPSGFSCFTQFNEVLGLRMKPTKAQPPAQVHKIQGVLLDTSDTPLAMTASAAQGRVDKLARFMNSAVHNNCLSPSEAAALAGKLTFVSTTTFGRCGRSQVKPIYARQHAHSSQSKLDTGLQAAMRDLVCIIQTVPPRRMDMSLSSRRFPVCYADAFVQGGDEAHRRRKIRDITDLKNGWGYVVSLPGKVPMYGAARFPPDLLIKAVPGRGYIYFLEGWAQLIMNLMARPFLKQHYVSFCDNNPAMFALLKGYSSDTFLNCVIGAFWMASAHIGADPWFERVSSKANISDCVSRFDFTQAEQLGWIRVDPPEQLHQLVARWLAQPVPAAEAFRQLLATIPPLPEPPAQQSNTAVPSEQA